MGIGLSGGVTRRSPSLGVMRIQDSVYGNGLNVLARPQTKSVWRASRYKGYGPLLDESGLNHDLRIGSVGEAFLTGSYLRLWGNAGQYASIPDANALDLSGDFDIRVKVAPDTWTPAAIGTFLAKYGVAAHRSYYFQLLTTGVIRLGLIFDGTTATTYDSTAAVAFTAGATAWVRGVRSGANILFYTSTDYNPDTGTGTWTQLGTTVVGVATALFNSDAVLEFGSATNGTLTQLSVRFYRAQIYSDATSTTKVFDANFAAQPWGTQHFLESSANAAVVSVKPGVAVANGDGLHIPAISGNYAQIAPGTFTPATDLSVRAAFMLTDWTPSTGTGSQVTCLEVATTSGYEFEILSSGLVRLTWYNNAGTLVAKDSTVAPTIVDGALLLVRADLDIDNGAAGYNVKFYTKTSTPSASAADMALDTGWTQLGTTVTTATATTIKAPVAALTFGARPPSTAQMLGIIYAAQVFGSLDSTNKLVDVNFNGQSAGSDYFTALTGQTVRVFGTAGADTNDPLFLRYRGAPEIYFPITNGNYAAVPDAAALDIVGDIDVRLAYNAVDWTPGSTRDILGKWGTAGNRSWVIDITTAGAISWLWTADGSTTITKTSTASPPVIDGQLLLLRITHDVDNGAAGNTVTFYYKYSTYLTAHADLLLNTGWVQLGTPVVTGSTTSIFSSASDINIGPISSSVNNGFDGSFLGLALYNGIAGSLVLDVDATDATKYNSTATSLTAVTGQTVTINRVATGRKTSVIGRPKFLHGTDDFMLHPDHPDLDIGVTDFAGIMVARMYNTGNQTWMSKMDGGLATAGWMLGHTSTPALRAYLRDASNGGGWDGAAITAGLLTTGAVRRVGTSLSAINNGVASSATVTSGDTSNALPLTIGCLASGVTNCLDGEFYGAAVTKETLTDAEITAAGLEILA